jgi:hypothetical protein
LLVPVWRPFQSLTPEWPLSNPFGHATEPS